MKCQDIQQLIIAQSDAAFTPNQKRSIEDHLFDCPQCKQFSEDLILLQHSLKEQPVPILSEKVESQTLTQCHNLFQRDASSAIAPTSVSIIPKWLWIALGFYLAIAIFWLSTQGKQFLENNSLSPENIQVLLFVLQNMIMLVLTPV